MDSLARVVVASTRAAAGVYDDTTGPVLVGFLRALGFSCADAVVVPDGDEVGRALRDAVAYGADVVITTGGTGISRTDTTPEQTRRIIDYEVPGIAEAIRAAGLSKVPTAMLSRGVSGVAGRTLIINVPGSRGGVDDAIDTLRPVLAHAVDQLRQSH